MNQKYDVIIIGKGPAGISASLYTSRANLKTLIIGSNASALKKAKEIENYYGFENPISGEYILETGIKQALNLGITIVDDEVTSLEYGESFIVKTSSEEYMGTAILIATGQPPQRPRIPGIKEFEGHGVSYCSTCDGFFFRNKIIGVLGSGNFAIEEALELQTFSKDITIYTDGKDPHFTGEYQEKAKDFKIVKTKITELKGDQLLNEIVLGDSSEKLDGLFVATGTASSVAFAIKLGIIVENNAIITDDMQKTNLDGVFAAGDCTGGFKQIATAVGQGAIAGRSIIEYVRQRQQK